MNLNIGNICWELLLAITTFVLVKATLHLMGIIDLDLYCIGIFFGSFGRGITK